MLVTQTQSYLCGSAPVQKTLSKPLACSQGGSSQCGSAMSRSVEARWRHFEGLQFGLDDVPAPGSVVKHVPQSPLRFPERSRRLVSPAIQVFPVITWRKWQFIITDEVSRRPRPHGGEKPAYKVRPKRSVDAPVWRRFSQPPPLQRWQQTGSSCSPPAAVKRKTTERTDGTKPKGQLALPAQAAQLARLVLFQPTRTLLAKKHPVPSRGTRFTHPHLPSQTALGKQHG